MTLRIKKNLHNSQQKGTAMLRLKSAQNTPKTATERHVTREDWEAYRQTQIGLDASLHALYVAADDVSRKKKYLDIMKHVRQEFAKNNQRLGIKTPIDDELLPLPDEYLDGDIDVVAARKIQADRVVDMDELALEIAMLLEFNPIRLDSLFKKISNAMRDACIKRGGTDATAGK